MMIGSHMIVTMSTTEHSALLNQEALVMPKPWVVGWAPGVTSGRGHTRVALANLLLVVIIFFAFVHQEEGGLDACPTDFDFWRSRVLNKLSCERGALVQVSLSCSISKNRLILNVHLLVDVQAALCYTDLPCCDGQECCEEKSRGLQ